MEKESIDYSAQARTNPVFMTAKTAVCLMAQAGIPDAAENVRQTDSTFSMDHLVSDGVFRVNLRGRIDTITAPELLKVWETEKSKNTITKAEINCARLQYISSAGLRVLMILQKGGAKVRLTGVNDTVWEILETTGFINIFEVAR